MRVRHMTYDVMYALSNSTRLYIARHGDPRSVAEVNRVRKCGARRAGGLARVK